jgi:lipopolysaccharide transport system ATP-binding protein
MTDCTVRCEMIGKRYRIGQLSGYTTLREYLADRASAVLRGRNPLWSRAEARHIWALRDVSFETRKGEAVGIIGRNGSGKTTLLKVLSRITAPTEGRALVQGRVGSLLEVGTGFHPELTGRENVYLSGAIIGMKRSEIDRKFDEIVAFSGVEKFLDTPVKRYSSGMFVRLGFSVTAHLEPEIMFIDEVLAVGDVEFQERCREKMQRISRGGGTVLFVSHNLASVKALCSSAILLQEGRIAKAGPTEEVIEEYLSAGTQQDDQGWIPDDVPRIGTGEAKVRRIEVLGEDGEFVERIRLDAPLRVRLTIEVFGGVPDAVVEIGISTSDFSRVASIHTSDEKGEVFELHPGWWNLDVELEPRLLPQNYALDAGIHHQRQGGRTVDYVRHARRFGVMNLTPSGMVRNLPTPVRGYFSPSAKWGIPRSIESRTHLDR